MRVHISGERLIRYIATPSPYHTVWISVNKTMLYIKVTSHTVLWVICPDATAVIEQIKLAYIAIVYVQEVSQNLNYFKVARVMMKFNIYGNTYSSATVMSSMDV